MRAPTTNAEALRWHNQALNDMALHLPVAVDNHDPQCGWFITKLVSGGPWVPARIWLEQEVCPETGELLGPEILKCEINGRERDPIEAWPWLASNPIDEGAFAYLVAKEEFARQWAPHEPAANPFKRVDWSNVPTPSFT